MRTIIAFVLCACAYAQTGIVRVQRRAAGYPPITIGVHNRADCAGTTSCSVAIGTPTAGSTIYCVAMVPNLAHFTMGMSDNVNAGNYQPAYTRFRDNNHDIQVASWYKENVAASSTTATVNNWGGTGNGQVACMEIKGTPTAYALDSNMLLAATAYGSNGNAGTARTPTKDGTIVIGGLYVGSGTPTAGTNYTMLDGSSKMWPEYWIQTTKTATNTPYTHSNAYYADIMAAFAPNSGGFCDSTMIFDWTGGTDGNTVAVADLQASTKGGADQPTSELPYKPGWTLTGAGTGLTYYTTAYQPLATARSCPFYSGTATGTLGLAFATSAGASHGAVYHFQTDQPRVTAAVCASTNTPVSNAGTLDLLAIYGGGNSQGNADFALIQWNTNGSNATFALEHRNDTTVSSTVHWTPNTQYWLRLTYNQAAQHTLDIYEGCGSNPTLLQTLTTPAAISGGGTADQVNIISAANSYSAGTNFYIGAMVMDILYGAALLP